MKSDAKTTRQNANRAILEEIRRIVESEPAWRFHQILQNAGVEKPGADQFYEESAETLANVRRNRSPAFPG